MPIYEYQCGKCEVLFENEHPMAFSGKVHCPACGSRRTKKVFHAAGVHFKGSGFYVTDASKSRAATNGDIKETAPVAKGDPVTAPSGEKKTTAKQSQDSQSTAGSKSTD